MIALEKRIAFDGAAGATMAKAVAVSALATHRDAAMPHEAVPEAAGHVSFGESLRHISMDWMGQNLAQAGFMGEARASQTPRSVVFIESDVPDIATLIKGIDHSADIVMLDARKDGVDAITTYLTTHAGVENVYIFSHGSEGHLSLGTADLDSASMQGRYADDLAAIKTSLAANANILVYGCDFALNTDGDSAARLLSTLTGASVAASTDATGSAALGGDFVLEDQVGSISAPNILSLHLAEDYSGLLAAQSTGAFTITTGTSGTATTDLVATATTADGAVKITVTITSNTSAAAVTPTANATFDSTAPASAYPQSLNGASALEATLQFGGSTGNGQTNGTNSATITIAYTDARTGQAVTVANPIINIDRIGGSGLDSNGHSVSNSSQLTVLNSGATLTKLGASSSAFNVTSTSIYETPNSATASGFSTDSNSDPSKGTSAGSVQVNGSYSTLSFNWAKQSASLNGGDRIDFIFSADTGIAANGTLPNKSYTDGQSGVSIATSQAFAQSTGLPVTYAASGLPAGLTINAATGVISGTIDHDASKAAPTTSGSGATLDGTYTVIVTATNDANNSTTQTFTIDSTNQAPTVGTRTAGQTNNDGDTIATVDASRAFADANGDPLTYTATGLPSGLTIDATSGKITGTVAKNATPGTNSVTVTATDDKGAAASETFNWVIRDVPPTASGTLANKAYTDGQSGITITTAQGFADSIGNTLTYAASGLPAGLSIDAASGKITGTINHDASKNAPSTTGSGATLDGKYTVTVTASDGLGGTAVQTFTIDSTNQAPVVGTRTADQHSADGNSASVDASTAFRDPNTGDVITYTATGLPTGLSINAATGLISGTIGRSASTTSPYTVAVTAKDDKGATTTETFAWQVDNVPPTGASALPDRAAYDGSNVSYGTAGGFTNPNGLPLAYSASGLPSGVTINAATGVISGTLDHDASILVTSGKYTIAVTVNDGQGGTATNTFHLVASNQAPVLGTRTANQVSIDGQTITTVDASTAFSDPNGDPLTYRASGLPAGLSIAAATGRITGTVAPNAKPGVYSVSVTSTDDKGAATVETFSWTVNDNPPTTTGTLPNKTYADASQVSITTASGFANPNGLALAYSATGLPAGLTIDPASGVISGQISHDASRNAPVTHGAGATLDGTYSVSVTVDDGQGGTAVQTFTFDATNNAPVLGTRTADQHGADGGVVSIDAAPAFSDANTGDTFTYVATGLPAGLSINATTGLISGTIDKSASLHGPFSVTVTITDDKGAAASETFAWQVDNVAPVASPSLPDQAASDGTAVSYATSGGFTNPNALAFTYSATGLPAGLTIDPTTGVIAGTLDHNAVLTNGGVYTIAVSVNDGQGGTATNTFHLTASNQAPVVGTHTSDQTNAAGQTVMQVDASQAFSDPNHDPMTYAASGLPPGLSIDSTGKITGTIAANAAPGAYTVTVTATDDKHLSTPETFTWTVTDVAPTAVGTIANVSGHDSSTITAIDAASAFSSPNSLPLSYSVTGLPAGLSLDMNSGQITGRLDHEASAHGSGGVYTVSVTANDGQGGQATQTFTIQATNDAPTVGAPTPDQTTTDGNVVSVNASTAFSDPNSGDVLSYTASGLPAGVAIDPTSGLITGTISGPGTYPVTVTATDDKGLATNETFNWMVLAQPTTTPIPNLSTFDSAAVSIDTASHFSSNGISTYSATGLPPGLSIDILTGLVSGTLDHDASNGTGHTGAGATLDTTYTVTVTSTGVFSSATNTFTIDVVNQAPVVGTRTPDQSTPAGQTISTLDTSSAFSDPNTGDVLTYTVSGLPPGLGIDSTGKVTGTVAATASPGAYAVAVTATDDKGAATVETFTWTITDVAPTINATLANQTYADATSGISIATSGGFTSPNGLALRYSASGLPAGLTIDPTSGTITGQIGHDASALAPTTSGAGAMLDGTYTVIVTASDGQGGTASQTFALDATNQAPALGTVTANQHGVDGAAVSVQTAPAFADPNTGDVLHYTATNLPAGLAIDPATGLISGTIAATASAHSPFSVTVTATDDKGAATSETFTWQVDDVVPVATPPLPDRAAYDTSSVVVMAANGFTNPNGLPLTYTATGLPSGLTLDSSTGIISGTLDHEASTLISGGVYTIAVTASDGQSGSATNTFHIFATNQAPLVGTRTADIASFNGQTITPLNAAAAFSDPNNDTLTYAAANLPSGLSIDPNSGHITGTIGASVAPGAYVVTVTATDDKGAKTPELFTWTITDNGPSNQGVVANQRFADSASGIAIDTATTFVDPNNRPLTYSATGLPIGLVIDPASGRITGSLGHDASANAPATSGSGATLDGTYTVTVTASDGLGGTATQVFTIDALNSTPGVSAQTADQHSAGGNSAALDVSAAFRDSNTGDSVTYAATGLPTGLVINATTGLVSGTIDRNAVGNSPYTVVVTATDDKGAATTETFNWTVGNVAPVATPPLADQAASDGAALSLITQNGFTNPNGLPLTFSATGLPSGITIDSVTGLISGTLDHDASTLATNGLYTIAVTVQDGQGGSATNTFQLTASNQAPALTATIADHTDNDGATVTPVPIAQAFSDPNGDPLSYTASNLPAGLAIDPATGLISGTIAGGATPGRYTIIVIATDNKGAATTETFNWTVNDVPPVAQGVLANKTFADGTAGVAIATAGGFTSPNGLSLTFTATGLPSGLAIDPATGLISGSIDHNASANAPVTSGAAATLDGTYAVVITASDGLGGSASQSFAIDARNQAPALGLQTADQHHADGAIVSLNVGRAFGDPNPGDTLSFAANGLPAGLAIDPATGQITGTIDKSASIAGLYAVTVTATDNKGAATTETFAWQVDNVPPTGMPIADRSAPDGSTFSLATAAGFSDPIGLALTYSASGLPKGLAIDPTTGVISGTIDHDASALAANGLYTIAVTAQDGQGGIATVIFHLTATNQAPVSAAHTPDQVSNDGATIPPLGIASGFTEPNGDPLTYTATNLPVGLAIDPATGQITGTIAGGATPGTYKVIVIAADDKGLATTETFNWTVNDVPPIAQGSLAAQSVADGSSGIAIPAAGGFLSPNGLPLTYAATGLPRGLAIDPVTGTISGTMDHDASANAPITVGAGATLHGTYQIVVTVSDGLGGIAVQTLTIDAFNRAPVLAIDAPDRTNREGETIAPIEAATAFQDPDGDPLRYTAAGLPLGLAIDAVSGRISGTITDAALPGDYAVTVTATDTKGATTPAFFTWHVLDQGPVVTRPIADRNAGSGLALAPIDTATTFTIRNGQPLIFSAVGLPKGLSIDPKTGVISGTVDPTALLQAPHITGAGASLDGHYTITVTADDGRGGLAVQVFAIDVINAAPDLVGRTPDQAGRQGQAIAAVDTATAFHDRNGDALTYAASGLPPGLSIDPQTGRITGTIGFNALTTSVTITATDDKGAATSETFTWRVDPVTVTPPPPIVQGPIAVVAQNPIAVHASGAVLDTVKIISGDRDISLDIHADGIVIGTVNAARALDGLQALDTPNAGIVQSGATSNERGDRYDRARAGLFRYFEDQTMTSDLSTPSSDAVSDPLRQRFDRRTTPFDQPDAPSRLDNSPDAIRNALRDTSLETGNDGSSINVETSIRNRVITVAVDNAAEAACVVPVAAYAVTQTDGQPLPDWLHLHGKGLVTGKVPLGVESIALKVKSTLANGIVSERNVTVKTTTGTIAPIGP